MQLSQALLNPLGTTSVAHTDFSKSSVQLVEVAREEDQQ